MGSKRATEYNSPSCCSKGDNISKRFTPQANSSFIETDEASSLSDEDLDEHDNTFSTIVSAKRNSYIKNKTPGEPEENVPACCKNKVKPIERKILDASVTSAPRGGTYSASRSFSGAYNDTYHLPPRETYKVTSNYTKPSFGARTDREASVYNETYYPRTHVPRPSRNYNTYENNQPKYYSTPRPAAYQSWSQNLSSLNGTRSSRQAENMGQDVFNATNQSANLPRNVRMVPRVNRLYANPNVTTPVNPAVQNPYTYNYIQNPYVSPYEQIGKTFGEQPGTPHRAYPQRPQQQSPYARLANPEMSSYIERRQSPPIQPPQRRYPQTSTPHERPHSAVVPPGENELPACCRTGNIRPKTAEASVERGGGCWGKSNKLKDVESSCNDDTCSKLQLVSDNTQTCPTKTNVGCQSGESKPDRCGGGCDQRDEEEPLDTLLEIRTPHRPPGGAMGMPFVLSINVSCADRSVVITPDKGYKAISSTTSSQG